MVHHASTSQQGTRAALAVLALLAIGALVLAVGSHAILADDHWILIATGREALRTMSIPDVDHFTFTYAGRPYVDWEWLSGVVLALVHDSLGATGLLVLRMLVLAGTVFAVGRRMASSVDPLRDPAALTVLLCTLLTLHLRVGDRPHNFGLLLLAVVLVTGARLAQAPTWPRMIAHGALLATWAQVHPSFYLGIAVLLAQIVDSMRRPDSPWRDGRRWAVATALVLGACASVPGGLRYYRVLFAMSGDEVSSEWLPVFYHLDHEHPWFYAFLALTLALGLSLVLVRGLRTSAEVWLAVVLVALAFRHSRMTAEAVVVAAGPIARAIAARLRPEADSTLPTRKLALVLSLSVVLVGWALIETRRIYPAPLFAMDPDSNPVSQADFLGEHRLGGRIYAPTRGANGYLTMRLDPAVKTAFDGRTPQLFPLEFCERLGSSMDRARFRATERSLRFDWVAIPGPLFDPTSRHWGFVVEASGDFELVHFDEHGMLFGRRGGARGSCGAACAPYRALAPWRMGGDWARRVLETTPATTLADELERLSRVPDAAAIAAAAALALSEHPGIDAASRSRLLALRRSASGPTDAP